MSEIIRIPVINPDNGHTRPLPPSMTCGGRHCASIRAGLSSGQSFRCNQDATCPDRNRGFRVSFLYPRKVRANGTWHYHQGIDIFGRKGVEKIVSVVQGTVVCAVNDYADNPHYGGYGKVVIIQGDDDEKFYFHAHCDSLLVREGQHVNEEDEIAIVGCTDYSRDDPTSEMAESMAHLHFEVASTPYPKRQEHEFTLDGDNGSGRLDPLARLESLGPYGPKKMYFPVVAGATSATSRDDYEITDERYQALLTITERDQGSGFFPLGANNVWHGGVHIAAPQGTNIRSPFDGTIVAARLDPDISHAERYFGSTNFILIRHEIPDTIFGRLQGTSSVSGAPARRESVGRSGGRRGASNPPDLVIEAKRLLHACAATDGHPYYNPANTELLTDGTTVEEDFINSIVRFQTDIQDDLPTRSRFEPDGIMTERGITWRELERLVGEQADDNESGASSPEAQPNFIYSLFMHLASETLNNALVSRFSWMGAVTTTPTEEERGEEQHAREEFERRRRQEASETDEDMHYTMSGEVGRRRANNQSDVEWVQRRLSHFELYTSPETGLGTFNDTLLSAIVDFQERYVPYYRDHNRSGDGRIEPGRSTYTNLCRTRAELEREETSGTTGEGSGIDARFLRRLQQRHESGDSSGVAHVVGGINCRVAAGDILWTVGRGADLNDQSGEAGESDETPTRLRFLLHWGLFSTDSIVSAWTRNDADANDDLSVDALQLITQAEGEGDGGTADGNLSSDEIRSFYASQRYIDAGIRTTQFKFCSEWGLNLDNTISSLERRGYDTDELREHLAPYLWWTEAGEMVPISPIVWHYNPIEFMKLYLEQYPRPASDESTSPISEDSEVEVIV